MIKIVLSLNFELWLKFHYQILVQNFWICDSKLRKQKKWKETWLLHQNIRWFFTNVSRCAKHTLYVLYMTKKNRLKYWCEYFDLSLCDPTQWVLCMPSKRVCFKSRFCLLLLNNLVWCSLCDVNHLLINALWVLSGKQMKSSFAFVLNVAKNIRFLTILREWKVENLTSSFSSCFSIIFFVNEPSRNVWFKKNAKKGKKANKRPKMAKESYLQGKPHWKWHHLKMWKIGYFQEYADSFQECVLQSNFWRILFFFKNQSSTIQFQLILIILSS